MKTPADQSPASPSMGITKRRYLATIGVLLVVIIVMASYILASSDVLAPEYPNEDTPLELQAWGVSLTMNLDYSYFGHTGYNYSSLEIRYMEQFPSEIGGGGGGGSISPDSLARMNYTEFSVPATVDLALAFSNGHMSVRESTTEFVGYFISDDTDPARFDFGDKICLYRVVYAAGEISQQGFSEDYMYQIGWKWSEDGLGLKSGFEFTVEDGKLYSWTHSPPPSIWDH